MPLKVVVENLTKFNLQGELVLILLQKNKFFEKRRRINSRLQNCGESNVKIAVIGQSMSGKSSLINNLLGQDLATVSATETSEEKLEIFRAPKNESVKFCEIPGISGLRFTRENFFEMVNLQENQYDYVFFVTKGTFNSDDLFLLKTLQKMEIPLCILRTNIQLAFENANVADMDTFLDKNRSSLTSKLRKAGVDVDTAPVFFVENNRKIDFELKQSINRMLEALPKQKNSIIRAVLDEILITEVTIFFIILQRVIIHLSSLPTLMSNSLIKMKKKLSTVP